MCNLYPMHCFTKKKWIIYTVFWFTVINLYFFGVNTFADFHKSMNFSNGEFE